MPISPDAAGGHGSFNIQNEIDSFSFLETNLSVKHPELSKEQIRYEALVLFNTRMFPKQVESYFSEKDGKKEMPVDEGFDVIDGKLVHPLYGEFDRMISNAGSPEEAESLRLYQETMVKTQRGTRVIMFDLHAVSEGHHAIRYADVSYKDLDGRVYIEKRIDLVKDNSPLSLEESWNRLQVLTQEGQGRTLIADGVPGVGIMVVGPSEPIPTERLAQDLSEKRDLSVDKWELPPAQELINEGEDVESVPNDKTEEAPSESKYRSRVIESVADDFSAIGRQVLTETASTLVAARVYVGSKLRRTQEIEGKGGRPHLVEKITNSVSQRMRRIKNKEVRPQKKLTNLALLEIMAATGAAVLGLPAVTHEMPAKRPRKRTTEKSWRLVKNAKELANIKSEKVRTLERKLKKQIQPERRQRPWQVAVERIFPSRQTTKKKQEEKLLEILLRKQEKHLRRQLRRWLWAETRKKQLVKEKPRKLGPNRQKEGQGSVILLPQEEKRDRVLVKKEERVRARETIAKIAVAWILWRLLAPEEPVNQSVKLPQEKVSSKTISKREPRLWLLLSIIWYLTAIREQGRLTNPKFKAQNSKLRKFPSQGIIFAASS